MTESILPATIPDEITRRWSISSAFFLADTPSSSIYRVKLADGSSATLKSPKPKGLGELPGMTFLKWRGGHGAVRLLKQEETVSLLEDAGNLMLRAHRLDHGEMEANKIIVDVLKTLHSPGATPPEGLTSLERHFHSLLNRTKPERDETLGKPLAFSADIARQLLANQQNIKPLHGDLHHDNIVSGGARGWLAIDPQGLLGDPAYDVANVFGNPLNALPDIIDPQRIETLCDVFADALNCSKEKILRYAIAHAGLSICWSLGEDGLLEQSENAQERLAFLTVARDLL